MGEATKAILGRLVELCEPHVAAVPCRSFQIIGVDVMLDDRLQPHLLELNDLVSLKLGRTVMLDDPVVKEQGLKMCTAPCFDHRKHAHAACPTDETVKVPLVAGVFAALQRLHLYGVDVEDHVMLHDLPFTHL